MTEAKHTPLPWKFDKNEGCRPIKGGKHGKHKQGQYKDVAWTVGLVDDDEDSANAEFICQAVNNHDALVKALEGAIGTSEFPTLYPNQREAWKAILANAKADS